jgi:hypothetical protein
VVVIVPVANVLMRAPAIVLRTVIVIVQLPLAGMEPPDREKLVDPFVAPEIDPPQEFVKAGVARLVMPAGYVSVNATPFIASVGLGFARITVSVEFADMETGEGAKLLDGTGAHSVPDETPGIDAPATVVLVPAAPAVAL